MNSRSSQGRNKRSRRALQPSPQTNSSEPNEVPLINCVESAFQPVVPFSFNQSSDQFLGLSASSTLQNSSSNRSKEDGSYYNHGAENAVKNEDECGYNYGINDPQGRLREGGGFNAVSEANIDNQYDADYADDDGNGIDPGECGEYGECDEVAECDEDDECDEGSECDEHEECSDENCDCNQVSESDEDGECDDEIGSGSDVDWDELFEPEQKARSERFIVIPDETKLFKVTDRVVAMAKTMYSGSLPTFEEDGSFPWDLKFNGVKNDYSEAFGPYVVKKLQPFEIAGVKLTRLGKDASMFLPTFCFEMPGAFIEKENDITNIYVLPAGHFRPVESFEDFKANEWEEQCKQTGTLKIDTNTTLDSEENPDGNPGASAEEGPEEWVITALDAGFFYYDSKIFITPEGYFVSPKAPRPMKACVEMMEAFRQDKKCMSSLDDVRREDIAKAGKLEKKLTVDQEIYLNKAVESKAVMSLAYCHGIQIDVEPYSWIKSVFLYFWDLALEKCPSLAENPEEHIMDVAEVYAFWIQLLNFNCYSGPIPPYFHLKDHVHPKKSAAVLSEDRNPPKGRRTYWYNDDGSPANPQPPSSLYMSEVVSLSTI